MIKYVFILEDEKKFQKEIAQAVLSINPQIQIRVFESLEEFSEWIKVLIERGGAAIHVAGKSIEGQPEPAENKDSGELVLLVSKEEFLGSHQMKLLKKTHELFLRKGLCKEQEPTSLVISSFDHSKFDLSLVEGRLVNNIIMKPFDQLILQQQLCFAMSGHHPPSTYMIQNMKMDAVVEMLKDVQIEAVSEVGFLTRSQRKIEIGHLAKYYSDLFKSGVLKSVFARCHDVRPHPQFKDEFQCSFVFYGMEEGQHIDINSRIQKKNFPILEYSWVKPHQENEFHLVMIDGDDAIQEFKIHFEDEVVNGHFYSYTSVEEFLFELDPTERLLKQNKIKSVPVEAGIKLILNETGEFILRTEPDLAPGQTLFGYKLEELKKLHLLDLIAEAPAKAVLKKFLNGEIVLPHEERIFSVERNRIEYLFRIESQEFKESKKKQKTNELFLKELTDAEKVTLWKKKSKFPKQIDAILIRDIHFDSSKVIWDSIQERLKLKSNRPYLVFLNAYRKKTEKDLKENEKFFTNVFFKSKEKSFLLRRLSIYFSNLKLKKPHHYETMIKNQVIEVGNPIHVKELSEAGLVLEYNRAIDLGEFRKFILWRPEETEMPTFLAICNYAEEDKSSKGTFLNHFVFYAINDFYLKHLRLWLLANYIHQKEEGGS